jgi:hypothetical protein
VSLRAFPRYTRDVIFVTGTKRSGTSMWMQILKAAGLEPIGDAFPKDWGETIRDANPEGFYEGIFRDGVYYRTNPHPKSGAFLHPSECRDRPVKVFIPGVVRSDLAFIDKVVVTMRNWREFPGSLGRLYAMERSNRSRLRGEESPEAIHLPPVLEWWTENQSLLTDVLTRRYPVHFVAYETTLGAPEATIRETLGWLGVGDVEGALGTVKPDLRTHAAEALPTPEGVSEAHAEVFDELYARVRDRRGIDADFIDKLNAVNDELHPQVEAAVRDVKTRRLARRRQLREKRRAEAEAEAKAEAESAHEAS